MRPSDLVVGAWKTFCLKLRNGGARRGVIVLFRAPDGRVVAGEASPLPGWSRESMEDVIRALRQSHDFAELPSLLFAREMALAEACGWANHPAPAKDAPLCALLCGDAENWMESAKHSVAGGARTLKVKIQPQNAGSLREFFHALDQEFSKEIKIRLDANRSMDFVAFMRITEKLPPHRVEFIEEPLREFRHLPGLIRVSPTPIALDETLREILPEELEAFSGAAALVFKPSLMGGWGGCEPFASRGRAMGMRSVISAAFESGAGISMLAALALRYTPDTAAGLDTYSFLETDILTSALDFSGHRIRPVQRPSIDEQKLDRGTG